MVNKEEQRKLFVATLLHDLKNPLLAQINALEQLIGGVWGKFNDEQNEIINLTLESCKYMQKLIFDALWVYKNDNGQIKLEKNYFNAENLVKKCIQEYSILFKQNNLKVNFKNTDEKNILYADEKQLRRVIENIFINQISYSLKNSQININITQKNNKMIFIFENTSKPINKKVREEMFEKYKSNYSKQKLSTGLGMYLSKQIIEAHQGKIYLICDKNINQFIFEIPTNNTNLSQIVW